MLKLDSLKPLFEDESPIPKDALKQKVIQDIKLQKFTGIPDEHIDISFDEQSGDDIILKVVDPKAASGYLVFQGESEYNGWLNSQLYEPSQEEIQEAANRGSRT